MSNTLKKFVGKLPTNCLSVFDHFAGLALKELNQAFITPSQGNYDLINKRLCQYLLSEDNHSLFDIHENIFACLFSVYNIISLSRHEQVCLMRLHFERYFSRHGAIARITSP